MVTVATKKQMIESVIDGHIDDIENWVYRDRDSLAVWLHGILGLDSKTKAQIKEEFEVYMPEEEI